MIGIYNLFVQYLKKPNKLSDSLMSDGTWTHHNWSKQHQNGAEKTEEFHQYCHDFYNYTVSFSFILFIDEWCFKKKEKKKSHLKHSLNFAWTRRGVELHHAVIMRHEKHQTSEFVDFF